VAICSSPEEADRNNQLTNPQRARLPGAFEMIYDNYNGLVFGFGPTERASEALFSIVLYPRWVTLFFLQGAKLADPNKVLKGSGGVVKHVVLASAADLDLPAIQELMDQARLNAKKDIEPKCGGRMVLKCIAAKQRPRRPVSKE
jgi:hypothetical protein